MLAGAAVVTRTTGPYLVRLGLLDAVALLMGLSTFAIVRLTRQRLPAPGSAASLEEWWGQQLGRAVLIWALLEMPAVIGAITLLATRHVLAFGLLGVLSVLGLVGARPSRLGARELGS